MEGSLDAEMMELFMYIIGLSLNKIKKLKQEPVTIKM